MILLHQKISPRDLRNSDYQFFEYVYGLRYVSWWLYSLQVNATYGALDLGGASTQIALVLNPKAKINSSDVEILKLYGQEYHVLAKSFLCFGLSQAADRSEAIIFMVSLN